MGAFMGLLWLLLRGLWLEAGVWDWECYCCLRTVFASDERALVPGWEFWLWVCLVLVLVLDLETKRDTPCFWILVTDICRTIVLAFYDCIIIIVIPYLADTLEYH